MLLSFLMQKDMELERDRDYDKFKQGMFASAFSAFDRPQAMKQYYEMFEKEESDLSEEIVPENEMDVEDMLNQARRLGVIK